MMLTNNHSVLYLHCARWQQTTHRLHVSASNQTFSLLMVTLVSKHVNVSQLAAAWDISSLFTIA